ncbi:MAG TPA: alpha/beta fold hydrolase [Pseudonocardiaceae bacterium]|jgi:predicted alpha/beta hydrolase|nr:alpha/beta fold hydrolase [Pseudonocardiaceae bacterium]
MSASSEAGSGTRRPSQFDTLESIPVDVPESATSAASSFVVRVLPAADPTAPVLLMLPAMAVKAKFYLPMIKALQGLGLSGATVDLRAQGESTPTLDTAGNFGYREMLEADLPAIVAAVRGRFPGAPVFLFGHSLGGVLSLLYSAGTPDGVAGVVTIGTGSVYWRAFAAERRVKVLLGAQYVSIVSRARGHWPAGSKVMGGPMAGRVMVDWARHSRTGHYRPSGSTRDYDRLLRELVLPVLMISMDSDPLGPRSTIDHLGAKLVSAKLTRLHLDEASGVVNRDHFAWVKDAPVVGGLVSGWVRENA